MQYHIFCAGLPLVYLIQQVFLDLIELRGQVDINLMRVEQTLCFFPQSFFFLPAVVGNLFYGRRLIDTFSVAEDGNHHFAHCVGAAGKPGLLPGFDRIEEEQVLGRVKGFIGKADKISLQFSGCRSGRWSYCRDW